MSQFAIKKHFDAPLESVFELISDFRRAAENVRGIEKLELLTDGPIGVGTRFRETRIMFGKEATEEMEVTAFDPPRGYTVECESCGCLYHAEYYLVGDIAGTHVRLTVTTRPVTLAAKLMSPLALLMSGPMKKCMEADLDDLRAVAESRAQPVEHV